MADVKTEIADCAADMDRHLDRLLGPAGPNGPGLAPERLVAAMRHGTLNGGKRLRPLLVRQSAAIFGLSPNATLCASAAVELVHCYSLIHDDLPAMDDDDTRRGKPSVHVAFDQATAILAGDALLTLAFHVLAKSDCHDDAGIRTALVLELAAGAGAGGMAGGQMRDLEGENKSLAEPDITTMQAMKTGALIRASVRMGALLGGATAEELSALTAYGEAAGRAFQIADDILDETATPQRMGKATGKDAARKKPTLVARIGMDTAKRRLGENVHNAISALTLFSTGADGLRATARYFATREF
ncbi:MAG: polyprenyl synthetase family protein [Alphaproteobacteria bacterium]|nr:polyprenyl synthetase family protein [Alphaproteobacteria bacterium]